MLHPPPGSSPPATQRGGGGGPDLHRLVEVDGHHLLHTVLDHLGREEVGLTLLVHGNLAVVLQQDGADRLGGLGHVDGPVIAHHLAEVGERPAVVQVEVAGEATWVSLEGPPHLPTGATVPPPSLAEGLPCTPQTPRPESRKARGSEGAGAQSP